MPIKVQLAVDMTCPSCVGDINSVLGKVHGVDKIDISLDDKQVMVEGTASPSSILKAIKDTGRSAVVRGTGSSSGGNIGAAVCIFEEGSAMGTSATRGLARFVQIDKTTCFVDITVSGISDGAHGIAIHECGDLSQVPESCGGVWNPRKVKFNPLVVKDGWGDLAFETDGFQVWEIIGRSMVINAGSEGGVLAGVVARSAGLFENDKQVCACSGNTLWTEQRLVDQGQRL
ncbi:copper chaperone [Coemansia furcata]|uniref:Copper chaperone n=1 Tax=Coemansia furcata TaxID=417177 RepID=A0ACC1L2Q7_9FUNG|nr:copper chaperone [Coemansia furcata]